MRAENGLDNDKTMLGVLVSLLGLHCLLRFISSRHVALLACLACSLSYSPAWNALGDTDSVCHGWPPFVICLDLLFYIYMIDH